MSCENSTIPNAAFSYTGTLSPQNGRYLINPTFSHTSFHNVTIAAWITTSNIYSGSIMMLDRNAGFVGNEFIFENRNGQLRFWDYCTNSRGDFRGTGFDLYSTKLVPLGQFEHN